MHTTNVCLHGADICILVSLGAQNVQAGVPQIRFNQIYMKFEVLFLEGGMRTWQTQVIYDEV